MDPNQAVQKQRSPWVFVLLGCGAFALLSCLGVFAFFGFIAKKGADMQAGILDPKTREENARKMLGELPEGYYPVASLSIFGMVDTAVLTDALMLADGGFERPVTRTFMYFRVMAIEQNKKTKEFFTSDSKDTSGLRSAGINIEARVVIKRGSLTVEGRRIYYVASRGEFDSGGSRSAPPREGLNTALLFDCPGDQLNVAVWAMDDPNPKTPTSELDLTGTVADEAQLVKLLKPVDPCGK